MKQRTAADYDQVRPTRRGTAIEWRTVLLIAGCHATWLAAGFLYTVTAPGSVLLLALAIVLHSSLQHEAIHGHPTRRAGWNEALLFLPLGMLVPYRRYRDLHLRHHADSRLTDPYDDPESYYLALCDYRRLPRAVRALLSWNNRLLVRMTLGPLIAAVGFWLAEGRHRGGDATRRRRAWHLHALGLLGVAAIVHFGFRMPAYAYLGAAYLALSLLALRSFCEHRWAAAPDGRTVIVERSLLAPLFLNNNLHLVHHKHPGLPWYALPAAYRTRRAHWQAVNGGYVFPNYAAVIRAFALRRKEPVAHPERGRS